MNSITDLIYNRRTVRRFQPRRIAFSSLKSIVDSGRLAPSGANLQPLEFIVVDDDEIIGNLFPHTQWAGYLPEKDGRPPQGQEPTAYIVVLLNRNIRAQGGERDVGAAIENMILIALDEDIGSCWLGSINREAIEKLLNIPPSYDIDSVLALGYAAEHPIMEPSSDSIKYYKDESGVLHVPKRPLDNVLHHNTF
ncbi:nitroreductase [candidate division KSB1 bacterium]|nr:nitroreductase [candidate division KSB1 bacterium]